MGGVRRPDSGGTGKELGEREFSPTIATHIVKDDSAVVRSVDGALAHVRLAQVADAIEKHWEAVLPSLLARAPHLDVLDADNRRFMTPRVDMDLHAVLGWVHRVVVALHSERGEGRGSPASRREWI